MTICFCNFQFKYDLFSNYNLYRLFVQVLFSDLFGEETVTFHSSIFGFTNLVFIWTLYLGTFLLITRIYRYQIAISS